MLRSFRRLPRVAVYCLGIGLAWTATCQAGQVLYGITQLDQLITINTSTGAGTLVGALSTSMNAIGLAQTGGNLYAFDTNNNVLQQIDPTSAATLATIAVGYTSQDALGEGDLAFNGAGTGFLVSSLMADGSFGGGSLFSLNLGANSHSLVKDGLTQLFSGLAFDPSNGSLYAMTADGSALYLVDPATGNVTLVGSTGISNANAVWGGLSFQSDGTLFATVGDSGVIPTSTLYTLSTASGTASFIGDIGFASVSGIAFLGSGPPPGIPEPSTGLLMLAVPVVLAARRKLQNGRQNHE
jgi:DNA-binding beta-propeller fold protein YncE